MAAEAEVADVENVGWSGVEVLCATLDLRGTNLAGYDFVSACEPIHTAEPSAILVASPDPTHCGRPMLALCDGGRQLAIAKWSLPALHRAARERHAWRARAKHGGGTCRVPSGPAAAPVTDGISRELELASRVLALLNGHCYSAWHARKRLLLAAGSTSSSAAPVPAVGLVSLRGELALSTLVLRRFPGAPDAWAHRRWLLSCADGHAAAEHVPPTAQPGLPVLAISGIDLDRELELCDEAAAAKRANYYGAQQRQWLLARLPSVCGSAPAAAAAPSCPSEAPSAAGVDPPSSAPPPHEARRQGGWPLGGMAAVLERELQRSAALLRAHPSDASAQASRQASVLAALLAAARAAAAARASSGGADGGADHAAINNAMVARQRRLAQDELAAARSLLATFAHVADEPAGEPDEAEGSSGRPGGRAAASDGSDTPLEPDESGAPPSDSAPRFSDAHRRAELKGRPQPHAVLLAHHRFATALCAHLAAACVLPGEPEERAAAAPAGAGPAGGEAAGACARGGAAGGDDTEGLWNAAASACECAVDEEAEAAFARRHWRGARPLCRATLRARLVPMMIWPTVDFESCAAEGKRSSS